MQSIPTLYLRFDAEKMHGEPLEASCYKLLFSEAPIAILEGVSIYGGREKSERGELSFTLALQYRHMELLESLRNLFDSSVAFEEVCALPATLLDENGGGGTLEPAGMISGGVLTGERSPAHLALETLRREESRESEPTPVTAPNPEPERRGRFPVGIVAVAVAAIALTAYAWFAATGVSPTGTGAGVGIMADVSEASEPEPSEPEAESGGEPAVAVAVYRAVSDEELDQIAESVSDDILPLFERFGADALTVWMVQYGNPALGEQELRESLGESGLPEGGWFAYGLYLPDVTAFEPAPEDIGERDRAAWLTGRMKSEPSWKRYELICFVGADGISWLRESLTEAAREIRRDLDACFNT